jgi:glycosyltransferase involved in cell wall biosynthesis
VFYSDLKKSQPSDISLAKNALIIGHVSLWAVMLMLLRNPMKLLMTLKFIWAQEGLPKASLLLQGAKLAAIAWEQNVDHFHAHFALNATATAIVAAKLTGCTVSFVGHGFDVYATASDLTLKLKHADFSVAVCRHMQNHFEQLAPHNTAHLVECGIELERYRFNPRPQPKQALLFIGRLTEKKGLDTLLNALALIPKASRPLLHIVGDGHLTEQLKALSKTLKITNEVSFLGSRPSHWIIEHASQYLALTAPFCVAPNGDRDTGPVVVKEAMALGLPVISTRFMGCKEIVSDNSGYLVPPRSAEALKNAITQVQELSQRERLSLLGTARKRVSDLYATEVTSKKLSKALEQTFA